MKVKELMGKLQKCNPEAEVKMDQEWTETSVIGVIIWSNDEVILTFGIEGWDEEKFV